MIAEKSNIAYFVCKRAFGSKHDQVASNKLCDNQFSI